jgi:DNA-binding transcriptional ArsR family regulator
MASADRSTGRSAGGGDADVARVAAMFADPSRARVFLALADGRALPASVLASEAGISAQATSAHLSKLLAENLLSVERSGRHRYYKLARPEVATALESLAALAPVRPVTSLRQGTRAQRLRRARMCYDHLAGRLGVAVTEGLVRRGVLLITDGRSDTARRPDDALSAPVACAPYQLGPDAEPTLRSLGLSLVDVQESSSPRPLLRFCVDWTEQRHHLSGALGAAVAVACLNAGCVTRRPGARDVTLTDEGAAALATTLDVDLTPVVKAASA